MDILKTGFDAAGILYHTAVKQHDFYDLMQTKTEQIVFFVACLFVF